MALDDADLLRETGEGFCERVEVALSFEAVPGASAPDVGPTLRVGEASKRGDDALPGLLAFAFVLDDLEVAARAGGFDADEHGRAPLGTPPY